MTDCDDGGAKEGFRGRIGRTLDDSEPWWRPSAMAPFGSPNIVLLLLDDLGYSDFGSYGSEINTPNVDRLHAGGYCLTNFHTTPVCAPSRASLLTGVNAHKAGFGDTLEGGFPGYSMDWRPDVPTLAESLQASGYATFCLGKWHLTGRRASNEASARDGWPLQRGFERFFGCLEGLTNLFHPHQLISDNSPVEIDSFPEGYFLTNELTDRAIRMIKGLRSHDAQKPFFLYLSHFAVHGPIQAPADDIARYRGRYDVGWDVLRSQRFQRQLEAAFFPGGTPLPPRNTEVGREVPAWDLIPPDQRQRLSRYMEVYAASVDNVDQNLGRLMGILADLGDLENTILVVTSDNGGTMEGGPEGTRSYFSQVAETAAYSTDTAESAVVSLKIPEGWEGDYDRPLEDIGGPRALVHYPRGWGMASNTPFRLYKGHTFAGGIRVPFILSWPAGLPRDRDDNGLRYQYQYVTDVAPTLLELAGIPRLDQRQGVPATAVDGYSFVSILRDPGAPSTHTEQYIEIHGHRGYYRDGWKLVTLHEPGQQFGDGEWELYHVDEDPTETTNLADREPNRLRELGEAWERAATENSVFPLRDGPEPPVADGIPSPVNLLPGTPTLERHRSSVLIHLRSFRIEIVVEHAPNDQGVLVAHGDQGGGYSVYIEDADLHAVYNEYGLMHHIRGGEMPIGQVVVNLEVEAKNDLRWNVALVVNEKEVGRLDGVSMLVGMAPFTGISVGIDRGGPVSWDLHTMYGPFPYTGRLERVSYLPGSLGVHNTATIRRVAENSERIYD